MTKLSPGARGLLDAMGNCDGPEPGRRDRIRRALAAGLATASIGDVVGASTAAAAGPAKAAPAIAAGKATVKAASAIAVGKATVKAASAIAVAKAIAGANSLALYALVGATAAALAVTPAYWRVVREKTRAPTEDAAVVTGTAAHAATVHQPDPAVVREPDPPVARTADPAIPRTAGGPCAGPADTHAERQGSDTARIIREPSMRSAPASGPLLPFAFASGSPPPSVTVASGGGAAARAPSHLAEEMQLLERAQRALRADNPREALESLDRYHERFRRGVLSDEERILRVLSLCGLGRREEAARQARALLAEAPSSPLLPRVRASCAFEAPEGDPGHDAP